MNIVIDVIKNSIILTRPFTKKVQAFYYEKGFDYSLMSPINLEKAFIEILDNEIVSKLKEEKSNSLVISDNLVAFGVENLPLLSKSKLRDVFETRFKIYYPNFEDYYLSYGELERNSDGVKYYYAMAKHMHVNKIITILNNNEIKIREISYFSKVLANSTYSDSEFPMATLIIGDNTSELIVSKGDVVSSVNVFPIGRSVLMQKDAYMTSLYNLKNQDALQFAKCVEVNFASNIVLTDDEIHSYEVEAKASMPREVRVLKGESLENYIIKNNFRRFNAILGDMVDVYSSSPWFIPIKEINVIANDDVFENLVASIKSSDSFKYVKSDIDVKNVLNSTVEQDDMFDHEFKKERRRIDWAKILSMEIGKKKKA